jgi:DNA transposition AAA+ family ATPase
MTERAGLYNNVALLRNVSALAALIKRLEDREHGLPGMATFYGPSGYGKSTAASFVGNEFQAHVVQVKSEWRAKFFCQSILKGMSMKPGHTTAAMLEQIAENLAKSGRTLIIDEADHLVKRNLIELARDIHEASGAPVILIGEELLPQNLKQWERVHGRMLDWVAAQPAELTDVALLARIYAQGIELDAEMREHIMAVSNASIRRICVNLAKVREFAKTRGVSRVTKTDWGDDQLFTGTAPTPRRFVA